MLIWKIPNELKNVLKNLFEIQQLEIKIYIKNKGNIYLIYIWNLIFKRKFGIFKTFINHKKKYYIEL
jgi:hypothetical protein